MKNRNGLICILLVVLSIITYLVIHLFCGSLKDDIYKENNQYQNNPTKQPINNIIATNEKDEIVAVNKIILSDYKLTAKVGKRLKISIIIKPDNATDKELIWETSNPSIAKVDNFGNIVALKKGEVTITVKTKDGTVKASCVVTVEPIKVKEIVLNPTKMSVKVNSSATIVAVTKPDDAVKEEIIWESSDKSIATVDNNGRVTGIKEGKVTITARIADSKVKATCEVTVVNDTVLVSNLKVIPTTKSIIIGSSYQLLAVIEPENATERDVVWSSSNSDIVIVDSNGMITGLKVGTATITVKTKDGTKEAACIVKVEPIEVDRIVLNVDNATIKVGNTKQLTALIDPEDATNKELVWTSADPKIATVDSTGKVTGVKAGEVIVTVKTKDGKVEAKCKVTVEDDQIIDDDDIQFSYDYSGDNYIYLINQFPIKDEVGKSLQGDKHTYDFKLRFNVKAVGVKYVITAKKTSDSDLDDKWAKMYLVNDGGEVLNCYRNNNRIKTFNEYNKYNNSDDEVIIYEGVITSSEASRGYKDFTFRMWVSEDLKLVNSNYLSEGKTFKAKVNVYASK